MFTHLIRRIMYRHYKNAFSPDINRHPSTQPKPIHTNETHSIAIAHTSQTLPIRTLTKWIMAIVDDFGDTITIRRYVYYFFFHDYFHSFDIILSFFIRRKEENEATSTFFFIFICAFHSIFIIFFIYDTCISVLGSLSYVSYFISLHKVTPCYKVYSFRTRIGTI